MGERLSLDAAHPGNRRPPRAPSCRPHSAQSQLAKARAVGLVTGPQARTPGTNRQWVVGPGSTSERTKGRGGESARLGRPTPRQRAPPPGTLMPPPQRAKPARKSAPCGVGDRSPCLHPRHPHPVGSRPRPHARTDERSGVEERLSPDATHLGKRSPPRAPSCRAHSAQSQLAGARAVGLVTPASPAPTASGKWAPAAHPNDELSGVGERPTPDAPHPGRRRPPHEPSCRPHSRQRQLARARAVGLVTGPCARTPRTHSQWVVGPGRTPERTSGRGWESARPRTPHTQAGGAPPGHPHATPTARKASSQECALWGW